MIKKKIVLSIFALSTLMICTVACNKKETKAEVETTTAVEVATTEKIIAENNVEAAGQEVSTVIPGYMLLTEWTSNQDKITESDIKRLEKESQGQIKYTINDDNTVTCTMSKEAQENCLKDRMNTLSEVIKLFTDESSDSKVPSFKEIKYTDDLSEITIVVDPSLSTEEDFVYARAFLLQGYMYQAYSGVELSQRHVTVNYVDDAGNVIQSFISDDM